MCLQMMILYKLSPLRRPNYRSEGCYGKDRPERRNSRLPNTYFQVTNVALFLFGLNDL